MSDANVEWMTVAMRRAGRIAELQSENARLMHKLAIAEKRIKTCERLADDYKCATGSRWWELQLQGETFLEAVDAAGRDEG